MNRIKLMYQKIEKYPKGWPEMVVVLLYIYLCSVVSFFHEPWYDESVAWLIARDSSIWDILFEIPHYEGHPPLWHLILVSFAKMGMPYELSLSVVSLFFTGTAILLIEKYAPFPRIVKWVLPFTYFFFYQYSVISRPYSVMMLGIVLLAMAHKKRNEKPMYYVGTLMLLCLTSAYGIMIAGGIAFAWLLEIKGKKSVMGCIKSIKQDVRLRWLLGLLGFAIVLCLMIVPIEKTYAMKSNFGMGSIRNIFYVLFSMIMDSLGTNIWRNYGFIQSSIIDSLALFNGVIFGCAIIGMILYYTYVKQTVNYFIYPYLMFSLFIAMVYCCSHHIGILNYILLFAFWIALEEKDERKVNKEIILKCRKLWDGVSSGIKQSTSIIKIAFSIYICCISIIWSINSSLLDIQYPYNSAKNISKFIKENHLENYKIMSSWMQEKDENDNIIGDYVNLTHNYAILPYFDSSIFMNGEGGTDGNYVFHKNLSPQDTQKWYKQMYQKGIPDVCIGLVPLEEIYGKDIINERYVMVYCEKAGIIWKGEWFSRENSIYVRKELAEELGLPVVGKELIFN